MIIRFSEKVDTVESSALFPMSDVIMQFIVKHRDVEQVFIHTNRIDFKKSGFLIDKVLGTVDYSTYGFYFHYGKISYNVNCRGPYKSVYPLNDLPRLASILRSLKANHYIQCTLEGLLQAY